jgi:hypothetical protein
MSSTAIMVQLKLMRIELAGKVDVSTLYVIDQD